MRLLTLAVALLGAAPTVLAQAPGVETSETIIFANDEIVGDEVILVGDSPHLFTYGRPKEGFMKGRNKLRQTESVNILRYDAARLTQEEELVYNRFTDDREHYNLTGLGDLFVWTYVTEAGAGRGKGKKGGREAEPMYNLRADVIDAGGERVAQHRLGRIRVKEFAESERFEARSPNRRYLAQVVSNERQGRGMIKSDLTGQLQIAVLDDTGALVSQKRQRLPGKRDQVTVESVAVDDDGGAYVLVRVYRSQKSRERNRNRAAGGEVPYVLKSVYLPAGAEAAQVSTLPTGGAFVRGIAHYHRNDGGIGLVGLYADAAFGKGADGRIQGVLTAGRADTSARLRQQAFSEADFERMGRFIAKKKLLGDGHKGLRYVYYMKGGAQTTKGVSVLLEGFQRVVQQGQQGGAPRITDYYFSSLVVDLDDDGNLVGANAIPKRQVVPISVGSGGGLAGQLIGAAINNATAGGSTGAVDKYYCSTSAISLGDRLGALYNDNPKNIFRDEEKQAKGTNWNKAAAILAYYDDDGELVRRPLFNRKDDKMLLHTGSGTVDAEGQLYVIGSRVRSMGANTLTLARLTPGTGGALDAMSDFAVE